MTDVEPGKRSSILRGLIEGVGHEVGDRVRQELDSARGAGDGNPAHLAQRAAAAAIGGAVGGVGQNVSALLREELGNARREAVASARTAARGAGLLGAAAAAGNTAGLFVGIAVWRGLGNRIGFAKSALVVAGMSGAVAAALANRGTQELARVRQSTPSAPASTPAPAAPTESAAPTAPAASTAPSGFTATTGSSASPSSVTIAHPLTGPQAVAPEG